MWRRLLAVFGAASLAATAIGAAVCAFSEVPAALWARNLAGWLVGAAAAFALAAAFRPMFLWVALFATPLILAATFVGPDQAGVHRWLDLGPLSMNAAMLLLPAALVSLAMLAKDRLWPWIAAFVALVLLVAQPDASQATALAAGMAAISFMTVKQPAIRFGLIGAATVLAVAAWRRPDPLEPVAEVEGIVSLAAGVSPAVAGAMLVALLAAVATPAFAVRERGLRGPALALSVCLLAWAAAPFFGAFPVPLAGVGLSPILGAWLGVGLLAGLVRRPA